MKGVGGHGGDGLPSLAMINEQTSFEEERKESKTEFVSRRKAFFVDANNDNANSNDVVLKTAK